MKHTLIILLGCCLGLNSCNDLDLNPLSQASSENWYSNETEIEMSVKGFYRDDFWPLDNEDKTDNFIYRETPYGPTSINRLPGQIRSWQIWIRRQVWEYRR